MEKLKGPDSISVVTSRFIDGYEVVRCVLDFYKGMAEIENTYATLVTKLLSSTSYTFRHSNIFMQLLSTESFEELGTVKTGWQKLGNELSKLVEHHSDKAKGYLDLRQSFSDLLPRLEAMKKTVRTKGKDLVTEVEQANSKHKKEKQYYMKYGNRYETLQSKLLSYSEDTTDPKYYKQQEEDRKLYDAVKRQETLYQKSVDDLVSVQQSFSHKLSLLYKDADVLELERIDAVSNSLQQFAKILSNTAPSYNKCMEEILDSVSHIDGQKDINSFVDDHQHLMTEMKMLQFEPHQCRRHSLGYPAVTNLGATPPVSQDQADKVTRQDPRTTHDAVDFSWIEDGDLVVVTTKTTGEPVGDHFKHTKCGEVVTQDSTENNSKEDRPRVIKTKKPKAEKPSVVSQTDETSHLQTDLGKIGIRACSPAGSDCNHDLSSLSVKLKPAPGPSVVKQRVATLERNNDNPTPPPSQQKAIVLDKSSESLGPPPVRRKTTSLNRTTNNASSPPVRRKTVYTDRGRDNPAVRPKTTPMDSSSGSPATHIVRQKVNTSVANPSPPSVAQKPTVAVKPKPTTKPQAHIAPLQREEQPTTPELLLRQLEQKTHDNDYYQLLQVDPSANFDEISRQRRERSKELHPDHFMDATRKERAEEKLSLINQVYTDVLSKERSRELYNQLCNFRKRYNDILLQEEATKLQKALKLMRGLKDSLRKIKMPLPLQEEVDLVLKLIQLCLDKIDS